jgi:hypothetical protein
MPLASRCLKKGARVVSLTGKQWTRANIGNVLIPVMSLGTCASWRKIPADQRR